MIFRRSRGHPTFIRSVVPLTKITGVLGISDYFYAVSLIPASFLVTRFSPGSLAWIAILIGLLHRFTWKMPVVNQ